MLRGSGASREGRGRGERPSAALAAPSALSNSEGSPVWARLADRCRVRSVRGARLTCPLSLRYNAVCGCWQMPGR